MKKIIGIVIASLVFCNVGFAEITNIDSKTVSGGGWTSIKINTVCVDGYKFVISRNESGTISMTQAFERVGGVSYLPAKC